MEASNDGDAVSDDKDTLAVITAMNQSFMVASAQSSGTLSRGAQVLWSSNSGWLSSIRPGGSFEV